MPTPTNYTYSIETDIISKNLSSNGLHKEINKSSISIALSGISNEVGSDSFDISFKDVLSPTEEAELDSIVENHSGLNVIAPTIQEVNVLETTPFAKPDYRTKRDATGSWITCPANDTTIIDFPITEERYVSGGEIIYKNAKEGDYITAEVFDKDAVVPEPYRPAIYGVAEDWPSMSKYIPKKWLIPTEVDGYNSFTIDTYPLNAQIPPYFYLRVTYHAVDVAGDRKCAINYHLTKKIG